MKIALMSLIFTATIFAQNNSTESNNSIDLKTKIEANSTKDQNSSLSQKHIQEQIEREKKYKEEQKFYQGDDYNLKEHEVDKKTVDKVPLIEPEYDFDITDLYAD